jgi:hypothetical protein
MRLESLPFLDGKCHPTNREHNISSYEHDTTRQHTINCSPPSSNLSHVRKPLDIAASNVRFEENIEAQITKSEYVFKIYKEQ